MRFSFFVTGSALVLSACSTSSTTSSTNQPNIRVAGSGGAKTSDAGRSDASAFASGGTSPGGGNAGVADAVSAGSGGAGANPSNGGSTASSTSSGGASVAGSGAEATSGGATSGGATSTGGAGTGSAGTGSANNAAGASGALATNGGSAGTSSGAGANSSVGGSNGNGGNGSGGNGNGGGATASGGANAGGAAIGGGSPGAGGDTGGSGGASDAGTGAAGCGPLTTKLVTSSLETPVYMATPPGDSRLFVLERTAGRVTIIDATGKKVSTFLDISSKINAAGFEAGLLSIAFHPSFAQNGAFYVTYTTASVLRVSRFLVPAATPNAADATSEAVVVEAPQTSHHNTAGMLLFGPDGDLYVSIGDSDDQTLPQDLTSLNGKMLRLAVDPTAPGYTIPAGNPFVGRANARPEIWQYGLREPYRYWFDVPTNNLYIADVGASSWEEVDVVPIGKGGQNFGWPIMEGTHCYTPASGCSTTGLTLPVYDFPHTGAETAIIGGTVYHGTRLPSCYRGKFFFGTYDSGVIDTLSLQGTTANVAVVPGLGDPDVSSFGQDANGELYLIDSDQNISRIVPQ
ncbi:MAG TPA: PQQ-dependent sugar dehydrogenase [Polyangiaceae bacterium]|nr:PQQ-dependent sugar dehydrogenase [Polyangiaceae bacterium]